MKNLLLVLLLAGCASTPTAILPPPDKTVKLDPRMLELCEFVNKLPEKASFEDVLSITITNLELYASCANKQKNSVKILKEFANMKE